jgi:opacity protein-like surface antigen
MNKKIKVFLCILILFSSPTFAFYFKENFREFGFSSGFLKADLEEKKDLKEIPLLLKFGFDLRPLFKNKSNYLMEFLVESYSSFISSPNNDFNLGCNFLLKVGLPFRKRFYPYLEAGVGFNYFTLQTREQATQFNFIETLGIGMNFFLKQNLSLNLGYRWQHLSNASIKKPNKGIDSRGFVMGLSFYY